MDYEIYPPSPELLPMLEKEQKNKGWISESALKRISIEAKIPISRVYYKYFMYISK